MNTYKSRSVIGLLILAALLVSACQSAVASTPEPPTATQTAPPPTATATLMPTHTPTATAMPTNTPTATSTPNATATAEARATQTAAPAIAMIQDELKKYDLSTDEGYLGWANDSLTIKVNTYGEEKWQTNFPDFSVADFVFHTDMKWESSTGLAGCTLLLRAEPDLDRGKHYRINLMRLSGLPLWDIEYYRHGVFQKNVTGEILSTSAIDVDQGAVNRITVIALGNKLQVYANGDRLGAFTDKTLSEGIVAYMAWQESGQTTCTFSNSWLWVFKGGS
ncbi:MAG TPA: hypothetical protein VJL59_10400 [Anaerolineales bacterium]|nr:hypothetical protein [Anaerolineales bacterium]